MIDAIMFELRKSFVRDIADFEIVEGKNPDLQTARAVNNAGQTTVKENKAPVIKKNKKPAEAEAANKGIKEAGAKLNSESS